MGLWEDIRFAARLLLKDKWFSFVAAVALALGIGVNATVFTFVNAVLIRGLPIADPDRTMAIDSYDRVRNRAMGVSYLDYRDWRENTRSFDAFGAFNGTPANLSDEGQPPERYNGSHISANTFSVLGARVVLGRDFVADDDRRGAPAVAIIAHKVWTNRYGSNPSVIGRSVRINDVPATIIGVMEEGFQFPFNTEVWLPLHQINGLEEQKRNARTIQTWGRLAPGVSREQAQSELINISRTIESQNPDTNKDIQARVQTFNQYQNGGPIRTVFLSLMGAVAFVLLIACANVANLLLSRATNRAREISVRVSLGASRWRVIRQLLIESVLLASISGIAGLGVALIGIRLFDRATQDVGRPYWIQFTMDGTVFLFFAGICLLTGIIFGLAPALHVSKTDVNEVLKEGGRSGSAGVRARRWTGALMVAELTLTVVLLAGAGFMMRNFVTMYRLDLGIDTSKLLTTALALPERKYPSLEQRLAFYERLQERLKANPRIESVTVSSNIPLQGGFLRRMVIDGKPLDQGQQAPNVTMLTVDPRYFTTLGLPVQRGRDFTDEDGMTGRESAIINQRFAQLHFPNEDPIGRRITLSIDLQGGAPPQGGIPLSLTATVVGIVPNVRQRDFQLPDPDPVAYLPFRTDPRGFMNLIARTSGDPNQITPILREEVRAIDPDLPLFGIRTMDAQLAQARWPFRIFGTMFAIFALIALTLSAVGLYAVTAYAVSQRTQEIGIRMALGAQGNEVAWLFLRRSFVQLAIGLTLGVAGAFGVGTLFSQTQLLVQNRAGDPITIGGITLLLAAVAAIACFVPAKRSTKLDPLVALRRD
ncbi:MAG TPA: ABC transporter permease [Vicinamibacterales bacterium]|nr:ABC transporter permease [Vicinamibacterales bacterium]